MSTDKPEDTTATPQAPAAPSTAPTPQRAARMQKSQTTIKRERRAAKRNLGEKFQPQSVMVNALARRAFQMHLRPKAVEQAVHTLVHTGPWRIAAPGVGMVLNTEAPTREMVEMQMIDRAANGQAFPGEFVMAPWRTSGLSACRDLIERGGDDLTPRDKIIDTLSTGVRLATEDGRLDAVMCLLVMIDKWKQTLVDDALGA